MRRSSLLEAARQKKKEKRKEKEKKEGKSWPVWSPAAQERQTFCGGVSASVHFILLDVHNCFLTTEKNAHQEEGKGATFKNKTNKQKKPIISLPLRTNKEVIP